MSGIIDGLASRKAVLAGLGGAALLIVVLAGVWVSAFLDGENSDTHEAVNELTAYHAKAEARPAVEAAYMLALSRAETAPGLIHAGNAALADARLENEFKTMANAAGADVRSAQALPIVRASGFEVVAVQFDLSLPASKLRDLAYAVETHTPYLFVDDVSISAPHLFSNSVVGADPSLEVRWTVRGYRWDKHL